MSDIVERLRQAPRQPDCPHGLRHKACKDCDIAELEAEIDRLREALDDMLHAVCGETGFAEAVRRVSGKAYPWISLDIAEAKARAALEGKDE